MATVYSNTSDGSQASGLNTNWDNVHDAVGHASPSTTNGSELTNGVRYEYVTGRGAVRYYLVRSFFDFDTSGIGSAPSDATFKIKVILQNSCTPCIIAKSGHDPSTTSDDWFSTWITGQSVTLSGWGSGDITAYSSSTSIGSVESYTDFTLNSDARDDMASLSTFKICLLHTNDYNDTAPTSGLQRTGMIWSDNGSSQPNLSYTPGTAAVTHSAPFFGTNF